MWSTPAAIPHEVWVQLRSLPDPWESVSSATQVGHYRQVAYYPLLGVGRYSIVATWYGPAKFTVVEYFTFAKSSYCLEQGTPMFDMPAEAVAYWELTR